MQEIIVHEVPYYDSICDNETVYCKYVLQLL